MKHTPHGTICEIEAGEKERKERKRGREAERKKKIVERKRDY